MQSPRRISVLFAIGLAALLITRGARSQSMPLEPVHDSGQSVTAAYEGWFKNADGTFSILLGYFNRNVMQELDIPIGPENKIEPGGPDRGQPTHFIPRRQWGVFTITVPADFGSKALTWTIIANGKTTSVPVTLDPLWEISPYREEGMGNTPPLLTFEPAGPSVQGPRPITANMTASAGSPLALKVRVADDAKVLPGEKTPKTSPVVVNWKMFRGPGQVTFKPARATLEKQPCETSGAVFCAEASSSATFSQPGEYELLVVAGDWSGEGGRGFQCCWTNAHVKVSVK